jgi:starch synthase
MTKLGRAVRLLEEGIEYADYVTTVSPTYAREIMHGEHGKRTQEVFTRRANHIVGILNGIDEGLWDPKSDPSLFVNFDSKTVVESKKIMKEKLRQALRLPQVDVPLFGFVGRFEHRQKGLDLIAKAIEKLPSTAFQIALLGTGHKPLIAEFIKLAERHQNVSFTHTFDERLARRIYAASDVMLVPSKFEPCGLTQMIAMRYGTLPLVRKTGGLADSVEDMNNGFVFDEYTGSALIESMETAIDVYQSNQKQFQQMIQAAMRTDFSWDKQADAYIKLYKKLRKK